MERIYVTRASMPSYSEYIDEIKQIWDSHWLTNMGIKHCEFELLLKKYLSVENVELLVNGHMAIELGLQAFDFPEGKEVITSPYTFASTTHAIVRNKLKPIFCDINENDFTIDVEKIEKLINKNTCAILPIHVYGNICNVEAIDFIAKKYNLKVLYDAAHAFGVKYNNIGIGNYGDAVCFSFHATKVFNSIEGGGITFTDIQYGKKIYILKNFGILNEDNVDGVGANAKLNEFCAAMGICNLRHIEEYISKRKIIFNRYIELLDGVKGIRVNKIQKCIDYNYSYFPIVVNKDEYGMDRNELKVLLERYNFIARKYFYPITSNFSCYKNMKFNETPIAQRISDNILTLPLFHEMSIEDVDKICEIVKRKK